MKTVNDLKVGDTVWLIDTANGKGRPPEQSTVTKIGSKLIEVEGWRKDKYRKDTLRINDNYGHWLMVLDLDDYEQDKKLKALRQKLKNADWSNVSYEDCLWIAKLIGFLGTFNE